MIYLLVCVLSAHNDLYVNRAMHNRGAPGDLAGCWPESGPAGAGTPGGGTGEVSHVRIYS